MVTQIPFNYFRPGPKNAGNIHNFPAISELKDTMSTQVIYFDFSKAFDSVNPP